MAGLVMSRRPGEKCFLTLPDGGNIEILIVSQRGNATRFKVDAPSNVKINRDEPKKEDNLVTV